MRKYFARILSYYLLFIFVSSIFISLDAECIQGNFEVENCASIINLLMFPDSDVETSNTQDKIIGMDVDGKCFCGVLVIPYSNSKISSIALPHIALVLNKISKIPSVDKPALLQPPRI